MINPNIIILSGSRHEIQKYIYGINALIFMGQTFAAAANNNNMLEPYTLKKGEILFSQSKRPVNAVNPTVLLK